MYSWRRLILCCLATATALASDSKIVIPLPRLNQTSIQAHHHAIERAMSYRKNIKRGIVGVATGTVITCMVLKRLLTHKEERRLDTQMRLERIETTLNDLQRETHPQEFVPRVLDFFFNEYDIRQALRIALMMMALNITTPYVLQWLGLDIEARAQDQGPYANIYSFINQTTQLDQLQGALQYYAQQLSLESLPAHKRAYYEQAFIQTCYHYHEQIEHMLGYASHVIATKEQASVRSEAASVYQYMTTLIDAFYIHIETIINRDRDTLKQPPTLETAVNEFIVSLEWELNTFAALEKISQAQGPLSSK